ncbi:SidA/IucD/PvdA family monooxygenase [Rhodobacteraceae bacterium 2CG4]|uniref:SidA/IucD/PvdA family monooxygenase n=2 Tax=Halovulum marinum TaxID=2662447 RepID=A0A6L5Z160_9RHOB|nr:SidA/IucD/PvdA family monooxygenase [Halovulum marinum]
MQNAKPARAQHPADLLETGSALRAHPESFSQANAVPGTPERHRVVVIGAGQAGLSVGYHLSRRGIEHLILDGAKRIGDVWRNRWDSLRLFTPAKFDGLDGLRFPGGRDHFPTKDEMADYLETYAAHHRLPVRLGARVQRLHQADGQFRLETTAGTFLAQQVVIAAASYQKPRVPAFAANLPPDVVQMHSHQYRNAGQIGAGPVLLVGAGNSGAEIAMDLAPTHEVWVAGRDVGHIPFDISGFLGRKILVRLVIRGLFHRLLTMRTPMGKKFRRKMHGHGMPLIRTRPGQLQRAGVRRIGRISGIEAGCAISEDGHRLAPSTVIWCTGYHPGFDFIDLPVLDPQGEPRHRFGRATDIDGLYFSGLHFQYAVSSTMIAGVGRDARRVAAWVAESDRRQSRSIPC